MTREQKIQLAKDAFNGVNGSLYDAILFKNLPGNLQDGIYDAPNLNQEDAINTMLSFTDTEIDEMEAVGIL